MAGILVYMKCSEGYVYSLRQVVELTGVSEFTMRGWESRYRAFDPIRTPTGRRLYSQNDVLRARAILSLTKCGHRVSSIARLPLLKLEQIAAEPVEATGYKVEKKIQNAAIESLISDAAAFRWRLVSKSIQKARKCQEATPFIFQFLLPLMAQIGTEVESGRFSIAQEHILTAYIKENIYALHTDFPRSSIHRGRFVFAAPEGDFHEVGLLVAFTIASLAGLDCLYLGPNVPKADLCQTCLRFDATHLILASTVSRNGGAKDDILQFIHFLDRQLAKKTELWLAGPNIAGLDFSLKHKFQILSGFDVFSREISSAGKRGHDARRTK
jgi:methanogenic corrinoid protein MtbC1